MSSLAFAFFDCILRRNKKNKNTFDLVSIIICCTKQFIYLLLFQPLYTLKALSYLYTLIYVIKHFCLIKKEFCCFNSIILTFNLMSNSCSPTKQRWIQLD